MATRNESTPAEPANEETPKMAKKEIKDRFGRVLSDFVCVESFNCFKGEKGRFVEFDPIPVEIVERLNKAQQDSLIGKPGSALVKDRARARNARLKPTLELRMKVATGEISSD